MRHKARKANVKGGERNAMQRKRRVYKWLRTAMERIVSASYSESFSFLLLLAAVLWAGSAAAFLMQSLRQNPLPASEMFHILSIDTENTGRILKNTVPKDGTDLWTPEQGNLKNDFETWNDAFHGWRNDALEDLRESKKK